MFRKIIDHSYPIQQIVVLILFFFSTELNLRLVMFITFNRCSSHILIISLLPLIPSLLIWDWFISGPFLIALLKPQDLLLIRKFVLQNEGGKCLTVSGQIFGKAANLSCCDVFLQPRVGSFLFISISMGRLF